MAIREWQRGRGFGRSHPRLTMELEYAFIATAAQVNDDGRFSVLGGGTDTLGAWQLPGAAPPLALVIKLKDDGNAAAVEHTVEVTISRPNGKTETVLAGHPFRLTRTLPGRPAGVTIVVDASLRMETPGEHRFHIRVDGEEVRSLPLFVVLHENSSVASNEDKST
jgi:Family of unknown function (DUF6941)